VKHNMVNLSGGVTSAAQVNHIMHIETGHGKRREQMQREEYSSLLLLLLDELALDKDIDLVADNKLAIEHHVERQAEVLPVDPALGAVADAVAHHGVIELPILHHLQCHRQGIALDSEVAGHGVAIVSGLFDPGAFEGDRRILVDFQKIRRPQVVVPLLVVGADAGRLHGNINRGRFGVVRIDITGCVDLGKVTAHRHHAQVLGGELDLRVERVKLPATLGSGLRFILRCHVFSSLFNEIARFCLEKGTGNSARLLSNQYFLYGNKGIPESSFCQGCYSSKGRKNVLEQPADLMNQLNTLADAAHWRGVDLFPSPGIPSFSQ